jgi:HSP20 family protein
MRMLQKWFKRDDEHGPQRHRGDDRLSRFREEMDRAFDRVLGGFEHPLSMMHEWPALDMAEDDKAVTLRVDVPGLKPEDLNVEVSGNVLTISGSREDEWKEEKRGVLRQERVSGSFTRSVTLPSYVKTDQVEAKYDKGTMTITIPKVPGQGPKRIDVKG